MLTVEVARSSAFLMRRMAGDIRNPSSVARVRRVLFDEPLNHEQTRRDLMRETEQLSSEMRNRWNFDFDVETPLQGRYEWQRTASSESVHPAYELRHISKLSIPSTSTVLPDIESSTVTNSGESAIVNREDHGKCTPVKASLKTTPSKCAQRKVTDFLTQRKRTLIKSANSPPTSSPKSKVRRTTT